MLGVPKVVGWDGVRSDNDLCPRDRAQLEDQGLQSRWQAIQRHFVRIQNYSSVRYADQSNYCWPQDGQLVSGRSCSL